MVGPEPTGPGGTHPSHTMTMAPAPAVSTTADNSTESEGPNKNDMFEEIKSKFLNEIDKIPRKSCRDVLQSHQVQKSIMRCHHHNVLLKMFYGFERWPNCLAIREQTKLTFP